MSGDPSPTVVGERARSLSNAPSASLLDDGIPDEFLCAISHNVMSDPVVIETGISYDRQCILDWFASGKHTCPITNTEVNTRVLISNIFLKNEIRKWREAKDGCSTASATPPRMPSADVKVVSRMVSELSLDEALAAEKRARLSGGGSADFGTVAMVGGGAAAQPTDAKGRDVRPLVQTLLLTQDKKQKKNAVAELFQLSSLASCVGAIAEAGGIDPLRKLLVEHSNTLNLLAASTLANVAAHSDKARLEMDKLACVPLLVQHLGSSQGPVRAAACSALKTLALHPRLRASIAKSEGLRPLVKLLKDSACRAKSAAALANLTNSSRENCRELATPAAIEQLIKLLKVKDDGTMSYAAATLEHLADEEDCRPAFLKAGAVKPLVGLLGSEDEEYQAVAAGVLRHLCEDPEAASKVQDAGALEHFERMLQSANFYTQAAALGTLRVLVNRSAAKDMLPNTSALPQLVHLLGSGNGSIREGSAALLMDLANGNAVNQAKIASVDAFFPLVQLVRSGSPLCRCFAAAALNNLATGNPGNKDKIIAVNGVPALVTLLHLQDGTARETGVRALLTLATDHGPGKQALASQGALKPLVTLLQSMAGGGRSSRGRDSVMYAVLALMQCATDFPTIQEQVAEVGGIAALVDVLGSSVQATKFPAAAALAALASGSPANRKRMASAGAIPLLTQVVQKGMRAESGGGGSYSSLRPAAAAALAYLGLERENKAPIAESGAISLLAHWLRGKNQACAATCAAALWHLALHSDLNRTAMVRAGVPATLRAVAECEDANCRMFAAGALSALEPGEEACRVVGRSGALLMMVKHYRTLQEFDYMAKEAIAMVLKQLAASESMRGEVLKASSGRVLMDLLACGDEFSKSHAAECICSLASDPASHDALLDLNVLQLLADLLRHAGTACQKQALWALHNLVPIRLALGDDKAYAKSLAANLEATLRAVSANSRDATIRSLCATILGFFRPEVRAVAFGEDEEEPQEEAAAAGSGQGSAAGTAAAAEEQGRAGGSPSTSHGGGSRRTSQGGSPRGSRRASQGGSPRGAAASVPSPSAA